MKKALATDLCLGAETAMPEKNPDLHGNTPDKEDTAFLLIDVINDLEFREGGQLLRNAHPQSPRVDHNQLIKLFPSRGVHMIAKILLKNAVFAVPLSIVFCETSATQAGRY